MIRIYLLTVVIILVLIMNNNCRCFVYNKEGFGNCSLEYKGGDAFKKQYSQIQKKDEEDKILEGFKSTCNCGK